MGELGAEVLKVLEPYLAEILAVVGVAAVAWARRKVQEVFAVEATAEAEAWADQRGFQKAGADKKVRAMSRAAARMPRIVRPLTPAGLEKVVQKAIPKGRERARSSRPPEAG